MQISGNTWEDIGTDTKNPGYGNNIFDENDNPINIKARLYKRGDSAVIEEKDTTNGYYKFTKKLLSTEVKNGEYYIEFDYSKYSNIAQELSNSINGYWHKNSNGEYDNYLYMPVQPNIGNTNGSKALTETVLPKEDQEMIVNTKYIAKTGYRRKQE